MDRSSIFVKAAWSAALSGSLLLAACGGGSDGAVAAPENRLSGTAAVGRPIVGGTVTVKCAAGSALSHTTAADGRWSVLLEGQTLPCAVQVSGGTVNGEIHPTPYHALAMAAGTVNLTPLTDLVLARMLGSTSPQTWFAAPGFGGLDRDAAAAALEQVSTGLGLSKALAGADPMTTAFKADGADALDQLLDVLRSVQKTLGLTHAALLDAVQARGPQASLEGLSAAFDQAWSGRNGQAGSALGCQTPGLRVPTSMELLSVSGPYDLQLGRLDDAFNFVASGTASLLVGVNGQSFLNGVEAPLTSLCYESNATYGPMVVLGFAKGHIDLFANNRSVSGISPLDGSTVLRSVSGGGNGSETSSGGSTGAALPGGLSLSKVVSGVDSLANSVASTERTLNAATNVEVYKHSWGSAESVRFIVSHAIAPQGDAGKGYETLSINFAKPSPLVSAQLDANGGICILQAAAQSTLLDYYKACSALGIAYDRSKGTARFSATALRDMVGGQGTFTMTGDMGFTAY